jgi:hypothetical protein
VTVPTPSSDIRKRMAMGLAQTRFLVLDCVRPEGKEFSSREDHSSRASAASRLPLPTNLAQTPVSTPATRSLTRLSFWRASGKATERWAQVAGSFGRGKP